MIMLRFLWYAICMLIFPVRMALYVIHSLLVFISKPGARFMVPACVLTAGILMRAQLQTLLLPWFLEYIGQEQIAIFDPYGVEAWLSLSFVTFVILFIIISRMIRPLIGAFSSPKRPLIPMQPFVAPTFKITRVRARIAVKKLPKARYDGNLEMLTPFLPEEIQALLAKSNTTIVDITSPNAGAFKHQHPACSLDYR